MKQMGHSHAQIGKFVEDLARDEISAEQKTVFEDLDKLSEPFQEEEQSLGGWLKQIEVIVEKFDLFSDKRDDLEDTARDAYEELF